MVVRGGIEGTRAEEGERQEWEITEKERHLVEKERKGGIAAEFEEEGRREGAEQRE